MALSVDLEPWKQLSVLWWIKCTLVSTFKGETALHGMVLHQCIYKSNYALFLFNYCLHTSPHATTISCDPVSFQEPLAFPPTLSLLHMYACQQAAESRAGS